jgi:hypothetical protein
MKLFYTLLFTVLLFAAKAQNPLLAWAKEVNYSTGFSHNDNNVTIDALGNIYTTNRFVGTIDFDPGSTVYNLTASSPDGDFFVSKLNAAGDFLWAVRVGGIKETHSLAVSIDAFENVLITGDFNGTADFDPGSGVFNMSVTAAGSDDRDIFILKLSGSGNFIWAKKFEGFTLNNTNDNEGAAIDTDVNGNIFCTGHFRNTVDFDPGPAVVTLTSTGGEFDAFVAKLDVNGNFLWAKQMGGPTANTFIVPYEITADVNGDCIITGLFRATVDFDPGTQVFNQTALGVDDNFILKLSSGGNFLWAKQVGGVNTIDDEESPSSTVDPIGNIYCVGYFSTTTDFNPGAGIFMLTPVGLRDIFILKLDGAGNFVWAKKIGGNGDDGGSCISLDNDNNIYIGGIFGETVDFDPGSGVYNLTANMQDMFLLKLNNAANFIWAISAGGNTDSDIIWTINVDAVGNIYTGGTYENIVDFDPCPTSIFNLNSGITEKDFIWKLSQGTVGMVSNDATVCSGSNSGTLTLSGYAGSIIRWESSVDNFVTVVNIANITATQNYLNLTQTTKYRAVVQNGTCAPANSTPATITVTNGTTAGAVNTDATVCNGSNSGTLTLSGYTGSIIRWESSVDNFVTVVNITNITATQNCLNLTQTTKYRAVVQNGTCAAANSTPATITVTNGTTAGAVSSDATVCSGSNSGTLTLSGYTGSIIRWESSINNFTTITTIANTTATQNYLNLTQTTKYRAVVQNGTCAAANSTPATITV